MNASPHLVYVVDDDRSARESLEFLIEASGQGSRVRFVEGVS
jgi:FixJ family two-component response regulator